MDRAVDQDCLRLLTQCRGDLFEEDHIVSVASKAEAAINGAQGRETFLIDASTPHGDTLISESGLMKSSVGWVTVHATESLRFGLHEWAVFIEHQGDSGDGSGLMLGIVPKGFNRYDSFISQCGGWCISRAGKLYGNWRRVDNNASVVSLVFGTGDRVVFELDMDTNRITVRVLDKYIIGEISDMPDHHEVLPAISCHYRNQAVRFEYHRVRDRTQSKRSWIERGLLPHAACLLSLSPEAADLLPIDSVLQYATTECCSGVLREELRWLRRLAIVARAMSLSNAHRSETALAEIDFTPEGYSVAPSNVDRYGPSGQSPPTLFAVNLSLRFATTMIEQALTNGTEPPHLVAVLDAVITSLTALVDTLVAAASPSHIHATALHDVARRAMRAHERFSREALQRIAELIVLIAIKNGKIEQLCEGCRVLLSSPSITLRKEVAQCVLRDVTYYLPPTTFVPLNYQEEAATPLRQKLSVPAEYVIAVAVSPQSFIFALLDAGKIARWSMMPQSNHLDSSITTLPALQNVSNASMAFYSGLPAPRVIVLARDAADSVLKLFFIDPDTCALLQVTPCTTWPCSGICRICAAHGSAAILWTEFDEIGSATPRSSTRNPISFAQVNLEDSSLGPAQSLKVFALRDHRPGYSWLLSPPVDGLTIHFGNPEDAFLGSSHTTIEFWLRVAPLGAGKPECRTIYQHGDRTGSGEVFLETALVDGVWCIRGGSRHDGRAAKLSLPAVPLPTAGTPQWVHVSLTFDGMRWCLSLDGGRQSAYSRHASANVSVESPRGTWSCTVSRNLIISELRVWSAVRGQGAMTRDRDRRLEGSEPALQLLCPFNEPSGNVIYDRSSRHRLIWVGKSREPLSRVYDQCPVIDDAEADPCEVNFVLPSLAEASVLFTGSELILTFSATDAHPQLQCCLHFNASSGTSLIPMYFCERSLGRTSALSATGMLVNVAGEEWLATKTAMVDPLTTTDGPDDSSHYLCYAMLDLLERRSVWPATTHPPSTFAPLTVDVSRASFEALYSIIKDHYRVLQTSSSRKASVWKSERSSGVCRVALRVLTRQCQIALNLRIRPQELGLVVHTRLGETDDTVGARLFEVICTMLNEERGDDPWGPLKEAVNTMLPFSVPLFFPSVNHRLSMAIDLLNGNRVGRSSSHVLLAGLIEHFANHENAAAVLESSAENAADQFLNLCCLLLRQLTEASVRIAHAETVANALSSLQFVLFSSCCPGLKTHNEGEAQTTTLFNCRSTAQVLSTLWKASPSRDSKMVLRAERYAMKLLESVISIARESRARDKDDDLTAQRKLILLIATVGYNALNALPVSVFPAPAELLKLYGAAAKEVGLVSRGTVSHDGGVLRAFYRGLREAALAGACGILRRPSAEPSTIGQPLMSVLSVGLAPASERLAECDAWINSLKFSSNNDLARRLCALAKYFSLDAVSPHEAQDVFETIRRTLLELKSRMNSTEYVNFVQRMSTNLSLAREFSPPVAAASVPDRAPANRWVAAFQLWRRSRGPRFRDVALALSAAFICDEPLDVQALIDTACSARDDCEKRVDALKVAQWALTAHGPETHDLVRSFCSFVSDPDFSVDARELCSPVFRRRLAIHWRSVLQVALRGCNEMLAPEIDADSRAQRMIPVLELLSAKWDPSEFDLLTAYNVPQLAYSSIQIFVGGSLRREPAMTRQRRIQFKDLLRRRALSAAAAATTDSDQPLSRTTLEEAALRSWTALRKISVRALPHTPISMHALNIIESIFSEIERDFSIAVDELRDSKYPFIDRITEHLMHCCIFLCSVLPHRGANVAVTPSATFRLMVVLLSLLNVQLPSTAAALPEALLGTLRHLLFTCGRPHMLRAVTGKEPSTLISGIFSVARGAAACSASEPLTCAVSSAAVKVLQTLAATEPLWSPHVLTLLRGVIDKGLPSTDAQNAIDLAVAFSVICTGVADTPRLGSTLSRWDAQSPHRDRRCPAILIDVAHSNGTATIITSVDAASLECDEEIPFEALCSPPAAAPPAQMVELFPSILNATTMLLENWTPCCRTVMGAFCVTLALRVCWAFAGDANCAAKVLRSGLGRAIYDIVVPKAAVLPQPLWALEEHCAILLSYHMRTSSRIGAFTMNFGLGETILSSVLNGSTAEGDWGDIKALRQSLHWSGAVDVREAEAHRRGVIMSGPSGRISLASEAYTFDLAHGLSIEAVIQMASLPAALPGMPLNNAASLPFDTTRDAIATLEVRLTDSFVLAAITISDCSITCACEGRQVTCGVDRRTLCAHMHIAVVWDGVGLCLYLNGTMIGSKMFAANPMPLNRMKLEEVSLAVCDAQRRLGCSAVRFWAHALDRTLLRPFAESTSAEGRLPRFDTARNELLVETFHFDEGTGSTSRSDSGRSVAVFHGHAGWAPSDTITPTPETDWRAADDYDSFASPDGDISVPRREWMSQLAVMDPASANTTAIATLVAISGHYARACILRCMEECMRVTFRLVASDPDSSVTSVLRPTDKPGSIVTQSVNLVRYAAFGCAALPSYDPLTFSLVSTLRSTRDPTCTFYSATALHTVMEGFNQHLASLDVAREPAQLELRGCVQRILSAFSESHENFVVEVPYHAYSPGDTMLQPLMLSGMPQAMSFLGFDAGRTMDYLTVYVDRAQKTQIGKFPDSQGQWPEIPISTGTWIFVKPTSTSKSSNARFALKTVSGKIKVAAALLDVLFWYIGAKEPRFAPAVLNLRTVTILVGIAHKEVSVPRLYAIQSLTTLFDIWTAHPSVNPCDQMAALQMLERLSYLVQTASRRDPSATPRLLQASMDLFVAASRAQAAFEQMDSWSLCARWARQLRDVYCRSVDVSNLPLVDALFNFPASQTISLVNFDRLGGSVASGLTCRRRNGSLVISCEKGNQTVRSDMAFRRGRWYLEVRILQSNTSVSVGAVTTDFRASDGPVIGAPFGQCSESWCFDGTRLCKWHNGAKTEFANRVKWKPRDVLGLLLDLEGQSLSCLHNGKTVSSAFENLQRGKSYCFCASTNPSGIEINTGGMPFSFEPPDGFLAADFHASALSTLSAFPLPLALAVVESGIALKSGSVLPPWFTVADAAVDSRDRVGVDSVQLYSVDWKARVEDGHIKSGTSLCSFKALVELHAGQWYFEVQVLGEGLVQVGWATASFALDGRHRVVGDDQHSWAIDGGRMLARHNRMQRPLGRHPWKDGEIVGCLLDCDAGTIAFTLNGHSIRDPHDPSPTGILFYGVKSENGFMPAVSLDPDSAAIVLLDGESMRHLPNGFRPVGVRDKVLTRALQCFFVGSTVKECHGTGPIRVDPSTASRVVRTVSAITNLDTVKVFSWPALARQLQEHLYNELDGAVLWHTLDAVAQFCSLFDAALRFAHYRGDISEINKGVMERVISECREYILAPTVLSTVRRLVSRTNGPGEPIKLNLNRRLSVPECPWQHTLLGQVYTLLEDKPASFFSTAKRLWSVNFAGEGAEDVGGPYRESLTAICNDIPRCGVMVPTPNNTSNAGCGRDKMLFSCGPSSTARHIIGIKRFLGNLMGASFRAGEPLSLSLPKLFWHLLVAADMPSFDDMFADVDVGLVESLRFLESLREPSDLEGAYEGEFVVSASNGATVPLFKGGAAIPVTFRSLPLFVALQRTYKTHVEFLDAAEAVVNGFYRVVPRHSIWWMRPEDLEQMVCGKPDFSVDEFEANVRYDGVGPHDRRVIALFQVLRDFTPTLRSQFARFVTGRERLSSSIRLKIIGLPAAEDDDAKLPTASTCFFWITLPCYSTKEVLAERLVFAMQNCVEIDADFRARESGDMTLPRATRMRENDDAEFEDYSHLL